MIDNTWQRKCVCILSIDTRVGWVRGEVCVPQLDCLLCAVLPDLNTTCCSSPQAVIDANIFPVLIEILQKAEFRTRKEAAWAITNATSGGTPEQIRYVEELLSSVLCL